ncbi:hypothetical protein DPMN_050718 [Dreissena polymorpha]|uniref:Kinesin motor domain-containing protein n=1 Tax=Dreissena polymorpha TaxID=45954 RepID=A0A9D4CHR3_DREPO|nr:hypothetical protein DPMN_050718 [Dreissena polymorpha]
MTPIGIGVNRSKVKILSHQVNSYYKKKNIRECTRTSHRKLLPAVWADSDRQALFEETGAWRDWEYTISVSVLEIYNEMIRDLLGDEVGYKMEVKMNPDGGYHIPGLCYVHVQTVGDVNECFRIGQSNRATASTYMNEHSSRSHALLCVTVVGVNRTTGAKTTG